MLGKSEEPSVTSETLGARESAYEDSGVTMYRDCVRGLSGPLKAWDLTEM